MSLDPTATYAAYSALSFVAVVPISIYWVRSLKRGAPIVSPPVRIAHLLLRLSPPIYALGAILGGIFTAIIAANINGYFADPSIVYINLVSQLFLYAGDIGITLVLYLSTIGSLYTVLGQTTWWKLLRLDAPVGGALLFVLDVAFFGRNVALANGATPTGADRRGILWLPLIIDLTLLAVTVGACGTLFYIKTKLKKRGEVLTAAMGKIPTFLLVASLLWTIRCAYAVATTIKTMIPDWTTDELQAQLIIFPILELWIGASVLALLTSVVKNEVWADHSIQPTSTHPAQGYQGEVAQYPQVQQQQGYYLNAQAQPEVQQPGYYPVEQQQPHGYSK